MNLSLQQALKYGTKEDLIASALNQGYIPHNHLLVQADAHEEAGEEGIADVLRAVNNGTADDFPAGVYPHTFGVYFGYDGPVSPEPYVLGSVDVVRKANETKPFAVHLRAGIGSGVGKDHKRLFAERLLTPQEAKAVTARLPNAAEIHQFIDHHFPEPKPESEAN